MKTRMTRRSAIAATATADGEERYRLQRNVEGDPRQQAAEAERLARRRQRMRAFMAEMVRLSDAAHAAGTEFPPPEAAPWVDGK